MTAARCEPERGWNRAYPIFDFEKKSNFKHTNIYRTKGIHSLGTCTELDLRVFEISCYSAAEGERPAAVCLYLPFSQTLAGNSAFKSNAVC